MARPTINHDRVIRQIRTLYPEDSTAIGADILKAVHALPNRARFQAIRAEGPPTADDTADLPPAAVVLSSDGGNNTGPASDGAARVARQLYVAVYTVGLGAPPNPLCSEASVESLDERALQGSPRLPGEGDVLGGILSHRAGPRAHSPERRHPLGATAHGNQRPHRRPGSRAARRRARRLTTLASSRLKSDGYRVSCESALRDKPMEKRGGEKSVGSGQERAGDQMLLLRDAAHFEGEQGQGQPPGQHDDGPESHADDIP